MKVNRDDLKRFMKNIRMDCENEKTELTDEVIIDGLSNYIEINPSCIDMNKPNRSGRYYYSTVGYGVMSLLGERYRMGRIEIFDKKNDSGYQVDEGTYCMPFESAAQFEDFIENIETDYPIHIEMGNHQQCQNSVSEELGIPVDMLNDSETKKEYYRKKNDEFAVSNGFKNWDDLINSTTFIKR